MTFKDFSEQSQGVQLLQRSLARGRLGHGYLFTGDSLEELESLAATLAKTLNCLQPPGGNGLAADCCDECVNCRKINNGAHADFFVIRPESKSRQIPIEQVTRRDKSPARVLNEFVFMKPTEARFKVGVIVAADRMTPQATNAFLKTLEEPPGGSVLILISTEPSRILETIISRCLRLNFSTGANQLLSAENSYWLQQFSSAAASVEKSLLGRYRLLDALLQRLNTLRESAEESVAALSPLAKYPDVEKELKDQWEDELKAGIEAEYRRQRGEILLLLQWWLRDVWLHTLNVGEDLMRLPQIAGAEEVARRITPQQAGDNIRLFDQIQRLLNTNVQEALALEVGLLKLQL